MRNRIAIDVNNNPFVDTYANTTIPQALAILQKDLGILKVFMDETTKLTSGIYIRRSIDVNVFIQSVLNAVEITIGKLDIPQNILKELLQVYNLITKYKTTAKLDADLRSGNSAIGHFTKVIEGYWKTYPEKIKTIKVGNMRIHIMYPQLKSKDLELFIQAFTNVKNKIGSTGIPHFSAAFYGDFFIVPPGSLGAKVLGAYWRGRDVISLDYNNIKEGVKAIEHSLVHEVCHRYYKKVLNDAERKEWASFYRSTSRSNIQKAKPQIGDSIYWKYGLRFGTGKGGVVTIPGEDLIHRIEVEINGNELYITKFSDGTECPISWRILQSIGVFPTSYAQESAEEFFCEVVPRYVEGDLHEPIKSYFEGEIHNKFVAPYQKDAPVLIKEDMSKTHTELDTKGSMELARLAHQILEDFKDVAEPTQKQAALKVIAFLEDNKSKPHPWYMPNNMVLELKHAHQQAEDLFNKEIERQAEAQRIREETARLKKLKEEQEALIKEQARLKEEQRLKEEEQARLKEQEAKQHSPAKGTASLPEMVDYILAQGSDRDVYFATSIKAYFKKYGKCSDAQFAAIEKIYKRLVASKPVSTMGHHQVAEEKKEEQEQKTETQKEENAHNLERLDNLLEKAMAKKNDFATKFTRDMIRMLSTRGKLELSARQEQVLNQLYRQFGV